MDIFSPLRLKPRYRRAKRRLTGCCLLVLLGALLACGALFGLSFYLIRRAGAQGPDVTPLDVMLIVDNSNSMYEKNGVGSDPDLLRIEAARLFITYLGVDSSGPPHRLGVIFFGGQAQLVVPLTPLADDARRAEMFALIADPPRMGWTDPQAALDLAAETLHAGGGPATGRAVVLLTDGKPERRTDPTPQEQATTIARLRETAGRFAADGVPLFIILLQNEATDADPEIERVFVPLWQEMAQAHPRGHFYRARRSEDLLDIYHQIVVALTGRQTAGVVVQAQVQTETWEPVSIEPGLAQVTFVVRKSDPTLQVNILRPDGRPLAPADPDVQYGGQPGQSREEVWAVRDPSPGDWQVRINGRGTVTIWKDFYPAPSTPTPRPTATPTSTPSPAPTATPRPTATSTPIPTVGPLPPLTLLEPTAPVTRRVGDPLPLVVGWLPDAHIRVRLESADGDQVEDTPLAEVSAGRYAAQLTLPAPGRYQLKVDGQVVLKNGVTVQDKASLSVIVHRRGTWWWLGLPLAVLGAGGGWFWYQRRRTAPLLEGTLRRLSAPAGREVPARLDLDALRQKTVRLGPDPEADLPLPHTADAPTPTARLVARREPSGVGIALVVEERTGEADAVRVNDLPLAGEWALHDGDVIQLGAYRFRYENLRRRAPAHQPEIVLREL